MKGRSDMQAAIEILKKVGKEYPQALYFYLKRLKISSADGSFEYFNSVYDEIKMSEPNLYECLELFSEFIKNLNVRNLWKSAFS